MSAPRVDRMKLLKGLKPIQYEPDDSGEEAQLRQMSLAGSLLALAEIDHEREHALCVQVARHLLGSVPEPDPEPDEVPTNDDERR